MLRYICGLAGWLESIYMAYVGFEQYKIATDGPTIE